jgi:uncharacterized membrane protein
MLFQTPVLALFAGAAYLVFGFEVAVITVLVLGFALTAANIVAAAIALYIELADIHDSVKVHG